MTLRIAAVNGKGGAGKTTAVLLIAGEFALEGKRVLLVDVDSGRNLALWWSRAEENGNLPENISVLYAASQGALYEALKAAADYDVAIFDTPGMGTTIVSTLLKEMDLVIVPVQATAKEIEGAGWAAEITADAADAAGRRIPSLVLRTRIALTGRGSIGYRTIRPWTEGMRQNEYDVHLLETELMERNPYKELYNGAGTLQMMELTESVKKARGEVVQLVEELAQWIDQVKETAGE